MKRFLSILLQSLALSLLLAHSVLPHKHHQQLNAEADLQQHRSARSLLDYLSLAFHADLGKGHLESFLAQQTVSAPAKVVVKAPLATIIVHFFIAYTPAQVAIAYERPLFPITQAHFLNPQLDLGKPLRAPPIES